MNNVKETLDAKLTENAGQRKINQYTLLKQLGSGSFGTVYLAEDTQKNIKVAIKECSKSKLRRQRQSASGVIGRGRGRGRRITVSRPQQVETGNPIDLVRSEVAILKKLDHKNVVKLFEVLDDPSQDSLFMVFELCEKGTILDVSMDKQVTPLDPEKARDAFQQLILGIEYLHEHEIAHRDIKPDNMLVSADGTIKIVDFGVSEMFSKGQDKMKNTAGSPAFYPPENVGLGKGELSGIPADIWAMGVTLYCLCFGKLPFVGNTIIQLYDNIRDTEPVYPPDCDPRLKDLFEKILEKNPAKRIDLPTMRTHPWVIDDGKKPLVSFEENCIEHHIEITQSDLDKAVLDGNVTLAILMAAGKFKNILKKSESKVGIAHSQ